MPPSRNQQRVASQLKFIISTVIQQELSDPRLGFITVLSVSPTEDYKEAKVVVSVLGERGVQSRTMHALDDARGYIQNRVANSKTLRLRNLPVLTFELETKQNRVAGLENLIEQTRNEDRERAKTDAESSEAAAESSQEGTETPAAPKDEERDE